MIAVRDLLTRLSALGCRAELTDGNMAIVGAVERLSEGLKAETRRLKPALMLELLREQALALEDIIHGDAPLAERLDRAAEYQEILDRLAEAQERLFEYWRQDRFVVMWSPLLEEFILAGDGRAPPGSEGFVIYTWAEIEALRDAPPERVRKTHKVKRAFSGTVKG